MLKLKGMLWPQSAAQSTVEKVASLLVGTALGTALGTYLENRDRNRVIREVHEEADQRVRELEEQVRRKKGVEELSTEQLFEVLAKRVRRDQLRDKEAEARRKIKRALQKSVTSGNGKPDGKVIDCAFED